MFLLWLSVMLLQSSSSISSRSSSSNKGAAAAAAASDGRCCRHRCYLGDFAVVAVGATEYVKSSSRPCLPRPRIIRGCRWNCSLFCSGIFSNWCRCCCSQPLQPHPWGTVAESKIALMNAVKNLSRIVSNSLGESSDSSLGLYNGIMQQRTQQPTPPTNARTAEWRA